MQQVSASRAVAPNMFAEADLAVSTLASMSTALASNAGDFGGYTAPIIGIFVLAATIGLLAGPVED